MVIRHTSTGLHNLLVSLLTIFNLFHLVISTSSPDSLTHTIQQTNNHSTQPCISSDDPPNNSSSFSSSTQPDPKPSDPLISASTISQSQTIISLETVPLSFIEDSLSSSQEASSSTYISLDTPTSNEYKSLSVEIPTDSNSSNQNQQQQNANSFENKGNSSQQANSETLKKLKNNKLLSFDEWKKENLAKSGQLDSFDKKAKANKPRSKPSDALQNSLGSGANRGNGGSIARRGGNSNDMGMIDELEIDPSIFGGADDDSSSDSTNTKNKLYKDRFNYASLDCAATIMMTNKEAKGASQILSENKDSYMLNKCSAPKKFVIIELCQDILVDTVAIGTYEFFSSMFKDIRISVADRYPVSDNGWKVLGEFTAQSVRDLQYFQIKNPMIWARYIKVEFLTHWGREFYCPVSVLRVYGTTMMEEYKKAGQGSIKKSSNPSQINTSNNINYNSNNNADCSNMPSNKTSEKNPPNVKQKEKEVVKCSIETRDQGQHPAKVATKSEIPANNDIDHEKSASQVENRKSTDEKCTSYSIPRDNFRAHSSTSISDRATTVNSDASKTQSTASCTSHATVSNSVDSDKPVDTHYSKKNYSTIVVKEPPPLNHYFVMPAKDSIESQKQNEVLGVLLGSISLDEMCGVSLISNDTQYMIHSDHLDDRKIASQQSNEIANQGDISQGPKEDESDYEGAEEEASEPTQESIYQTIMKRIALLESNATLSMQYIESQTQSLLEQIVFLNDQQDSKLEDYISKVNSSLTLQLHQLEMFYNRIISAVDLKLQEQRRVQDKTRDEDNRRINEHILILANDLRYQKQIGILQAIVLLIILVFVIITRGASIDNAGTIFGREKNKFRRLGGHSRQRSGDTDIYDDYTYTGNEIENWRRKLPSGVWLGSPASPSSPTSDNEEEEEEDDDDKSLDEFESVAEYISNNQIEDDLRSQNNNNPPPPPPPPPSSFSYLEMENNSNNKNEQQQQLEEKRGDINTNRNLAFRGKQTQQQKSLENVEEDIEETEEQIANETITEDGNRFQGGSKDILVN